MADPKKKIVYKRDTYKKGQEYTQEDMSRMESRLSKHFDRYKTAFESSGYKNKQDWMDKNVPGKPGFEAREKAKKLKRKKKLSALVKK